MQFDVTAQSWQTVRGGRFQTLPLLSGTQAGFTLLPPQQTGIWFTNVLPESRYLTNQILPNGSGVAAGDVDGDSLCDLYFCGLNSPNRLFRNLGNWKFQDITETSGVACEDLDATGAVFADLDGDGDLDLVVNSIAGGTRLFFNQGQGSFTPSPQVLNLGRGGTSLALADADGDGDLDLYIANYRAATLMDSPGTRFSVKMVDSQPVISTINGRPLTDPEWTNRFRFKIALGPGGRGTFSHEELGEPDLFCLNDGRGHFEPVSWMGGAFVDEEGHALPTPPFDWGLSVVFRDFNGDGSPDLYVCNDFGTPDRFWLNNGRGQFRAAPPFALRQSSLAAMAIDVADLNRDGHDDFIVVEMLSRDHRRRLTQRNVVSGELTPASVIAGRPQYPRNMLYSNRGDGTYAEIAQWAGLEASEWSWAPLFLDADLDGYDDLLVANGFERDNMNMDVQQRINQAKSASRVRSREELLLRKMFPRLDTENLAFRNRGEFRFEPVPGSWGFNATTVSQGSCLADLDNDGDLDVIVNNMNDAAGIYRNDATGARVQIRLKGTPPNTRGIGARIRVLGGAVATQSQQIVSGGRYLSSDDAVRTFAAGTATNQLRIEVQWRSGQRTALDDAVANTLYEIDEASIDKTALPQTTRPGTSLPTAPVPLFENVSHLLKHVHVDEPFDDWARQPLLPKRLSQLGPGVSWFDLNADGWDDLVIASGKGGHWNLYLNDQGRGFSPLPNLRWGETPSSPDSPEGSDSKARQSLAPPGRDQTSVLGWINGAGQIALLAGSANYEDGLAVGGGVRQGNLSTRQITDLLTGQAASTGPLALGDVDGDGDLDLFVGGRTVAGRYPEPTASALLRNENGRLQPDPEANRILTRLGMVSGAVFGDLNGDGFPELILACEWGPIRIFRNDDGAFTPWNPPIQQFEKPVLNGVTTTLDSDRSTPNPQLSTLSDLTGWWNGINVGDFDGDGRLDLAASNWGRNSKYQSSRSQPLRVYYGDLDGDRVVDIFEAHFDAEMKRHVPERMLDRLTKALPFLAERFPTHEAYAKSAIEDVLGEHLNRTQNWSARWLESTVLLNRSDRFEVRPLPLEAQLAPAFAVCVGDGDGDGHEDIFLSQNFFGIDPDTSRYDAGRGLWLRGDGRGEFSPIPGGESGVKVYGEQRGAALCDYDADGRVDLVVTQNSSETRLFHNVGAQPGLRVRLQGLPGNPQAVGAVLRIQSGDQMGPAREIHAGSGYWSQDSSVQVFAAPKAAGQLQIRWPGGRTTTSGVPAEAREITVGIDGAVKVIR